MFDESTSNQGDFCEVCLRKDDEDLYIVFNALFRVVVGEFFAQSPEKATNELPMNSLTLFNAQQDNDIQANQEKLQLFREKISNQTLVDLVTSPKFDLLLREVFKSKYSRIQDANCKHLELAQ